MGKLAYCSKTIFIKTSIKIETMIIVISTIISKMYSLCISS